MILRTIFFRGLISLIWMILVYIYMMCSDFVNPLKMSLCSEKHPVFGAITMAIPKKVVIDRWSIIEALSAAPISANFDI